MIDKICSMNCYCPNINCNFKHYLPFNDRIIIIKVLSILNLKKEKINYEKKTNCIYGIFCKNCKCSYYHIYNIDDRRKIIENYDNFKKIEDKNL